MRRLTFDSEAAVTQVQYAYGVDSEGEEVDRAASVCIVLWREGFGGSKVDFQAREVFQGSGRNEVCSKSRVWERCVTTEMDSREVQCSKNRQMGEETGDIRYEDFARWPNSTGNGECTDVSS